MPAVPATWEAEAKRVHELEVNLDNIDPHLEENQNNRIKMWAGSWWLTPVIPATQEAEIKKIAV
jgi:hypothetical protein